MKFLEIFARKRWTSLMGVGTLCAFALPPTSLCNGESNRDEMTVRLAECENARLVAEQRYMELNARLIRTERHLEESRREFSTAHLEAEQLRMQLEQLNLQLASVLVDGQSLADGHAMMRYAEDTQDIRLACSRITRDLLELKRELASVLDVLVGAKASIYDDALHRRLDSVAGQVGIIERVVSRDRVSGGEVTQLRVLSIDDDLQVVIVGAGLQHGIRAGMTVEVEGGSGDGARLRIIEVSSALSAATAISGQLRHITTGAKLTLLRGVNSR